VKHFFLMALLLAGGTPTTLKADITGKVVQWGKTQTTPASDQDVVLRIFEGKKQIAGAKTKTNTQGQYTFTIEDHQPQWYYRIQAVFEDTPFDSDFFSSKDQEVKTLLISPSTGSLDDIRISEIVFLEFGDTAMVRVSHQIDIQNNGDKTYSPKAKNLEVLFVELQEGGFSYSFEQGITREHTHFDQKKNQLFFNLPLLPGASKSFRLSYSLTLDSRAIDFKRANLKSHKQLNIISNQKSLRIPKQVATTLDVPSSLNSSFVKAYNIALKADTLNFQIRGLPSQKFKYQNIILLMSFLLALVLLALVLKTSAIILPHDIESLKAKIKTLQKENQTPATQAHIQTLQVHLYHLLKSKKP